MKSFHAIVVGWAAITLASLGCEAPELPQAAKSAPVTPPAEEPKEEPVMVAGIPGPPMPEDENAVTDVPRKFTAHDPIQGRRSRQAAQEGYSLGIATTAAGGFYAKHQSMILAIDQANQLYWPQHDFSYPKTHEAFMKDVVALALNGIPLPKIPEDEEYIYVPEQAEVGLQIRLIPGSPRSKIPSAEPGKEHIFDPAVLAAAGVEIPTPDGAAPDGEYLSPDPREREEQLRQRAEQNAAAPPAGPQAAEEPSPNIRTRAEQLGERANSRLEDHAVAPGGLAPINGLE
jgi:hypothetical protein